MPEGVLEALGYFGPEAVPALRIVLDNKWPRVRADAVYALGQGQKGPAAVTLIMHALDDRDARVRLAALKALGWTVQDPDVLTSIYQKALKDPNENVRAAVAEALRRGSNP
jgi:HEAT repeat protein